LPNFLPVRVTGPVVDRTTSLDPIGFAAGDANLDRYVGNSPSMVADPKDYADRAFHASTQNGSGYCQGFVR
jgi:hypothetical protein